MYADGSAGCKIRFILIPEFRRLLLHIPLAFLPTRREHALLGAGGFLVAADAGDNAGITIFFHHLFESQRLARRYACRMRQGSVGGFQWRAEMADQLNSPFFGVAITESIDFIHLQFGIAMDQREWHAPEKRLARQVDHDIAVLAK